MLHDLSSREEVINGCVKLAVVQNFGLDKMVSLQYRQMWVRATMALQHSDELVARNPVLSVRPPSWQTKLKIQVRLSGGIRSIWFGRFIGGWVDKRLDISGCSGAGDDLFNLSDTHHATAKVCGEGWAEIQPRAQSRGESSKLKEGGCAYAIG